MLLLPLPYSIPPQPGNTTVLPELPLVSALSMINRVQWKQLEISTFETMKTVQNLLLCQQNQDVQKMRPLNHFNPFFAGVIHLCTAALFNSAKTRQDHSLASLTFCVSPKHDTQSAMKTAWIFNIWNYENGTKLVIWSTKQRCAKNASLKSFQSIFCWCHSSVHCRLILLRKNQVRPQSC